MDWNRKNKNPEERQGSVLTWRSELALLKIVNVEEVAVSDEDVRSVAEMMLHPKVLRWDSEYRSLGSNIEELSKGLGEFLRQTSKDESQFCLLAKMDGKTVGFLGIHRFGGSKPHVGDVGIIVHPDYQRRGIGTRLLRAGIELASRKRFKRLEADTLGENKCMRKTAEKAGFQLEGIRRQAIEMRGELKDEALYAIML